MIRPLFDPIIVNKVYRMPEILGRIRHDDWSPEFENSPDVGYLGAWAGDMFCGFFMIREKSRIDVEVHACLLPDALPHSRVLGAEVLRFIFNASSVLRVSAPIIGNLVSAMNYVRRLGFQQEGVIRGCCRKNGELLDVVLFGLTRTEFEANNVIYYQGRRWARR
ncbi:hypothetical protein PIN31009_05541 [Pandoraea iniqua]|uniref:DUF2824 family protein n=1 Tax=Pandoraea iniqua TaxID=2508288 RepID=UPI0012417AC8|nr:DUF2824 family protein [Pandoraea iniqua]VVE59458.1 hypothetical protein PIN31009_05541 [Pandoraea iniqua]